MAAISKTVASLYGRGRGCKCENEQAKLRCVWDWPRVQDAWDDPAESGNLSDLANMTSSALGLHPWPPGVQSGGGAEGRGSLGQLQGMPEGGSGLGIWGGQSLSLAALGGESLRVPAAWEGSAGESPMPWDVAGLVGPDDAADELFRGGGLAALQGEGGRAAGEGDVSLGLPGPHAASLHAGRGLTKVVGEVGRQMSGWGTGGDAGAVGAVGEGGAGGIEAELERVKQERDSLERKLRAMERREPPEPALPATNQLHTELIVSGGGAANHDAAWKEGDGGEASPLVPSSGLGLVLEQGEPQASPSGQPHRILKGAKSVKEAEASASPASGGGSRGSEGDEWGSLAPAAADAWSSAAAPARRRVSFHDPPALEAHALGLRKGKGKLSAGKDSSSQCGENVGSPHDSAAEGQEEPAKRGGPGASEQGAAVAVEATKGREGESCGPKASEQSQESQQQQRKTPEKAKREVSASSVGEGPVLRVDPKKKAEVPRETVRGAAAPTKKGETEGAGGGKGGAGGKASRGKDNRRSSNQASHGRGKHGRWQAGGEDDDDEDEEDDEAAGLLGRLWRLLCQLDGELGSCTLTLAYFWVYLALHGPTTRLLIIGLIVLTQLSYTVQYPLALWAPINSALDTARDSTLRIFGRGGGRGRAKGGSKRGRSGGMMRVATWAVVGAALVVFGLMLQEVLHLGKPPKLPGQMPGMPGLVVDLSGRRFVKTHTMGGVEVHVPVSALSHVPHIRDSRMGDRVIVPLQSLQHRPLPTVNGKPVIVSGQPLAGPGFAQHAVSGSLPPVPPPGWPVQQPWPPSVQGAVGSAAALPEAKTILRSCPEGSGGVAAQQACLRAHADRLCDEAQASEARGLWEEVRGKLEVALAVAPEHVCSLYNYGRLLDYVWNDPVMAEEMYRRAVHATPTHVPSLRNFGYLLYFVRRDYAKAAELWERALAEQPAELDVLSGYGSLQFHVLGPPPLSLPSHAIMYRLLTGCAAAGNVSKAEILFQQALLVSMTHSNTLYTYATLLRVARNVPSKAETLYQKLLKLKPLHQQGHLEFAAMLETRWRDMGIVSRRAAAEAAAEVRERLLAVNPSHADALLGAARAEHVIRRRPKRAEKLYKRLLADHPANIAGLAGYAALLEASGRLEAAERLLKKMVLLAASDASECRVGTAWSAALVRAGNILRGLRSTGWRHGSLLLYTQALSARPLRSLPVAGLPRTHRCWLCSNATRASDLCCAQAPSHVLKADDQWWSDQGRGRRVHS